MHRKTTVSILLLCTLLVACSDATTSSSGSSSVTNTSSVSSLPDTYSASDFTYSDTEYTSVSIDLASLSASYENGNITVDTSNSYTTIITNTTSDKYHLVLTGTSAKGVEIVSADESCLVTLDGVDITSPAYGGPALWLASDTDAFLVISGTNTLADNSKSYKSGGIWDTNLTKGTLFAGGNLAVFGSSGTLTITATPKHGIYCSDVLCVQEGTLTITLDSSSSDGTCIKTANGFVMNGGTITLTGENSTEGSENKGIKVDGDESSDGAGKGYILINDGILTSTTSGKGISAGWDIDDDATTTDTSDDPYPDVFINGGAITITTTATPREDSSSTADDGVSPEGIEGKRNVTITGGTIVLSTTDDAINVSSTSGSLLISGGTIFAESSNNDAIDSNGDMIISGGTIIALGSSSPECGLDCDYDSSFTYTGGTIIALGGDNNKPTASATTGYVLYSGTSANSGPGVERTGSGASSSSGSFSSSNTFAFFHSSGTIIVAFTLPSGYTANSLLVASDSFISGSTITYTKSATVSGYDSLWQNVLYEGDSITATGTTKSVSLSAATTSISF